MQTVEGVEGREGVNVEPEGAVAVPTGEASLSALGWAELGERYPELMPEKFRGYDVYSDPQLIRESPFAPVVLDGAKYFHFKATDPIGGKSCDAWVDPLELSETFGSSKFLVENAHDRAFGQHTKARRLADRLRR